MTTPLERLKNGYWNSQPVSVSNPGGLAKGGHVDGFPSALSDVADVAEDVGIKVDRAETAASQAGAWPEETSGAVTRLSATQIQVAGIDLTSRYRAGRAILLDQTTDAYGYVASSEFTGGNTVVTVTDCVVDTGLTKLYYGQDPRNAPAAASSTGADLYLYDNFNALGY